MPVQLKCKICGGGFQVPPSRADKAKYCGQDCYHKSKEKPKVQVECKNCDKDFEVTENDYELGKGQFCRRSCRSEWRTKQRRKRNAKECEVCGDVFYPKPANVRAGKAQRCSEKCKGVAYQGEGHPQWSTEGRRIETNGYAVIRLDSGEWVQEHRHIIENIIGRKLDTREEVHHRDHNRANNDLDNLCILNKSKHRLLHNLENLQEKYKDDPVFVKSAQEKIDRIEEEGREEIIEALKST